VRRSRAPVESFQAIDLVRRVRVSVRGCGSSFVDANFIAPRKEKIRRAKKIVEPM
jgi:hypothetical protein